MSKAEQFTTAVAEIDERLRAVAVFTDRPRPPADPLLPDARWAIVRALAEMASFQEKYLFAPIEATGTPELVAEVRHVRAEMKTLADDLVAHSGKWSADAVMADWPGFCRAVPPVHRRIREFYTWEAQIVLPMFVLLDGGSASPTYNWMRPVWDIQSAFQKSGR